MNALIMLKYACRQGRDVPDPLVKVFDLRTMRSLPPVPFSANPAFVSVMPKKPSTIAITSSQGLINIVDVADLSSPHAFYQVIVFFARHAQLTYVK